jgi:YVTN family beta-propeller protein
VVQLTRRAILLGCVAGALVVGAAVGPGGASAMAPGGASTASRAGTNLLVNPSAEAGAFSVQGWDAVTIPGWRVTAGLPTVVRYGTRGSTAGPGGRGRQLFAGGAGGSARLSQVVSLRTPGGGPEPAGTRYRLSAWLGGSSTSTAVVTVTLRSASGRVLARSFVGPVGATRRALAVRVASGVLPRGAARAEVTLDLVTSLTSADGPNAPLVGYDGAVADDVSFSLSGSSRRPPPLHLPAARVPRFDHVFLFYFENQDYRAIVGNRKQAPFLNGILPHASLLADLFAEAHPSDANYLALAGGSAFGIPLTDPLEANPRYTIHARNLGDLVNAAGGTWKGYLQSANGSCDDTVHGNYWNDDLPWLYFADVRERPAYCAAHVVPLAELRSDLASPSTTPSLAWVGADDCDDMEGCGIRAGDRFLASQLGSIMASPAWRTQRSLAIITFDEDAYDHERPAQRVATLVLGSAGVRAGYVSHVRYTHYSLLRTIEAALGLGTLTRNDGYAQPANDVFATAPAARDTAVPARTVASGRRDATAFVVNSGSSSVTPVDLVTRKAGGPIRVGSGPVAITYASGGRSAFVVGSGSNTVTPIDVGTRTAGRPIAVGVDPEAIALTPDGRTAFVVNRGSDTVTPIDVASRVAGAPIAVGSQPRRIATAPDGRTAYVLNWGGGSVTPIDTATERAGPPIPVGSYPFAIAFSPDGSTAYVANYGSDSVTPIDVATNRAGSPIAVGAAPDALAVTPDGKTVEVVSGDDDVVTPITVATHQAGRPIRVGYSPAAVGIRGAIAYVVNTISGTLTPISGGRARSPISVGQYTYPLDIAFGPGRLPAVVLDTYSGQVTLVDTHARRALRRVKVGRYPVAVAIAP